MSNYEHFLKSSWYRYFRLAQGNDSKEDLLFQDNKSCMQLHKNYHFSIGKGSKYINARCFFAVDKMEKKEVKIDFFPTDHMTTDYSAKPTQGYLFPCQRNVALGEKKEDFSEFKL